MYAHNQGFILKSRAMNELSRTRSAELNGSVLQKNELNIAIVFCNCRINLKEYQGWHNDTSLISHKTALLNSKVIGDVEVNS